MSANETWLLLAVCGACCAGAAWAAARVVRRRLAKAIDWMPRELKDHTLAYSERTFRSSAEPQVVARVDRAYRRRDGQITLVELKTRRTHRPQLSDVIELSAQRIALEGETGEPVARIAWVVVEAEARRTAHQVTLMSPQAVWDLASRRKAILAGTEPPNYPAASKVCAACVYRARCHPRASSP